MNFDIELEQSINYLKSDKAIRDLEADPYWPKWDSPWWHMLLLYEMGKSQLIPDRVISKFIERLNKVKLKIFQIHPHEMPAGLDPFRDSLCHCQLGLAYQVLFAKGVDVDQDVPWIRPWFLRYQMGDGGFNCDNEAYLQKDETPSSMVGTIGVFEAIVKCTSRPWTSEEKVFLDKGAQFLLERQLRHGSKTKHNASEREDEADWLKLCFPRFYFYDVLRGLTAILFWAEKTGKDLPKDSVKHVLGYLEKEFPDGKVKIGRTCYEGTGTILPAPSGEWIRKQPATLFPLLQKLSAVGEVSSFLTEELSRAKVKFTKLISHL